MVNLETETILVIALSVLIIGYLVWTIVKMKFAHRNAIKEARKDTASRQRATIKGDISEIIAPWSMDAVDSVKELSFMGSPIDFVGFKGLDGDGDVDIKLIEVKSGKSALNKNQRRIRDAVKAIDHPRLQWVEFRIEDLPELNTKEKTIP